MAFISKKIEDLINFRIVEEEKSSRLYLAMSKWLNFNGYTGASALWKKYSDEELAHSEKAYNYLEELDILPKVPQLPEPKMEFDSLEQICKLSYEHEINITKECNILAKTAFEDNDFMTLALAQWYLTEQTEEVGKTVYWLDKLDAFGTSKEALRLLDNEMNKAAK